jgi:anti-anti-sigma regulatory factor
MQFRADVVDRHGRRIVRLAGRLEGEQSAELLRVFEETRKPVRLDLTDLLSADTVGLDTLRELQGRGAEPVGASPYLALQLATAQARRVHE